MPNIFLVIGLGNPGAEYQKTRHNVGFIALDEFQKENGFPPFKLSKKHSSLISEGFLIPNKDVLNRTKIVLAKPQTFMNNSGKAVKSFLGKTKSDLVIIHDDIDILLGKVKISKGSGSAGHKGVESIIQALGTKNFTRIRIGIQPVAGKPENVEDFVLQIFKRPELPLLRSALQEAAVCASSLIR